jgi:hypothetical protein
MLPGPILRETPHILILLALVRKPLRIFSVAYSPSSQRSLLFTMHMFSGHRCANPLECTLCLAPFVLRRRESTSRRVYGLAARRVHWFRAEGRGVYISLFYFATPIPMVVSPLTILIVSSPNYLRTSVHLPIPPCSPCFSWRFQMIHSAFFRLVQMALFAFSLQDQFSFCSVERQKIYVLSYLTS